MSVCVKFHVHGFISGTLPNNSPVTNLKPEEQSEEGEKHDESCGGVIPPELLKELVASELDLLHNQQVVIKSLILF